MRTVIFLFCLFLLSCVKDIDSSELIRNNVFDQNGEDLEPWLTQTGSVESNPNPAVPDNIQYVFKYKVTNQMVIEHQDSFDIVFIRFSGNQANPTPFIPKIYKENNNYFFNVNAFNFTNPDGNFCFSFSLRQIGQDATSAELIDCWKI